MGYGDILPKSDVEIMIAIAMMVIGVFCYSFTMGSLASFLTEIDTRDSILTSKLAAVHEFAKETGIDNKVKHEIRAALKYNTSVMGTVWSEKHSLFHELPKSLRYEVTKSLYHGNI